MAGKLFKYLPKPTSFLVPSTSGNNSNGKAAAGFSGPIVSIVPEEARGRKKAEALAKEPTSPKVSCIGRVEHGSKSKSKKSKIKRRNESFHVREECGGEEKKEKKLSAVRSFFYRKARPPRPQPAAEAVVGEEVVPAVVGIGAMRKFVSGRESALANFDWRKVAADIEGEEEEEEVRVAFSGPILMGGGVVAPEKGRKEVNLWKRRTLTPPEPLHIKS